MKQEICVTRGRTVMLCVLVLALACLCSAASAGSLKFPAGMTRIADETFYGDKSLDEVILCEPLSYIGHRAFARSSVRFLYIPDSVKTIEEDAFDHCPNLVCLVSKGSYAQKWCDGHGVAWHTPDYVASITPAGKSVTVKNGAKQKARVNVRPSGALDTLVWKSSDKNIFTVNRNGEITGRYPGRAKLVVSSADGKVSVRISVIVQANYRAVLFSESTFAGGVIKRNRGDVRLMKNMLAAVTGPDGGQYSVTTYDDLVASDVYARIKERLINPSRDGDVSIFFFASHGDYRSTSEQYAGRLWCVRKKTWVELPALAKQLTRVQGKVIVLLESCGPGAVVHEFPDAGETGAEEPEDDPEACEAIISAFAAADPGLSVYRPAEDDRDRAEDDPEQAATGNLFMTEKFIVMTAAAYLQASYSIGSDTYNLFPVWLAKGVGTAGDMPADAECGDSDGRLAVKELYQYVYDHTKYRQTPQVYPRNSDYILFLRAQ